MNNIQITAYHLCTIHRLKRVKRILQKEKPNVLKITVEEKGWTAGMRFKPICKNINWKPYWYF